jgi:anti-sigma B factor antagonist
VRNTFTLSDEGVDEQTVVVSVTGDLDLWNAPALEQRLRQCVEAGKSRIIVDLTRASFLDSSGLGALTASMRLADRKGARLAVVSDDVQLRRVFELTGLARLLNVVPARAGALALLGEP